MQEQWDFYLCKVDEQIASINLNLGLAEVAPLADYPIMAYVHLHMREPRPDGLSSNQEYPRLEQLEEQLIPALCANGEAIFAGRNTTAGCRDFYFYLRQANNWPSRVATALANFSEYEYSADSREDAEWSSYFDFLYPGEVDLQRMQNRRICVILEQNGDTLSTPREIRHWAFFANSEQRQAYIDQALATHYKIEQIYQTEDQDYPQALCFSQHAVPAFNEIDSITLPLFFAAQEHDGYYDGWETEIIKDGDAESV